MNNVKCQDCVNYDVQIRIIKGKPIPRTFGRCAKQTTYPAIEPPGIKFPEGVARADEGTNPKPSQIKIVDGNKIVKDCLYVLRKSK